MNLLRTSARLGSSSRKVDAEHIHYIATFALARPHSRAPIASITEYGELTEFLSAKVNFSHYITPINTL